MQLPRRSFLPLLRACAPSLARIPRADFRCLVAGVMPRIPAALARGLDSACRALQIVPAAPDRVAPIRSDPVRAGCFPAPGVGC